MRPRCTVVFLACTITVLSACTAPGPRRPESGGVEAYFDAVSGFRDGRVDTTLYHGNPCGNAQASELAAGGPSSEIGPAFDLSRPGRLHRGGYGIATAPGRPMAVLMSGRRSSASEPGECQVWAAWTPEAETAYEAVFYWELNGCTAGVFARAPGSDGKRHYRSLTDKAVYDGDCRRVDQRRTPGRDH